MTPGQQFGERFTIVGELSRGGMAVVYLATDHQTDTHVALKVLHPHLSGDPAAEARLRREVKAGARFRSDGALLATALHEFEGQLALSMPVHQGVPLQERVQTGGTLSSAELEALGRLVEEVQPGYEDEEATAVFRKPSQDDERYERRFSVAAG